MAKKPKPTESPDKLRPDVAETAFRVFQEAIGEAPKTPPPAKRQEKNSDAVMRGRKGGAARAAKLSEKERSEVAQVAAGARWRRKE